MMDTTVADSPEEPEESLYDFYDNRRRALWGISDFTHGLPAVVLRKALIIACDSVTPVDEVYHYLKEEHAKLVAAYDRAVTVFSSETEAPPVSDEEFDDFLSKLVAPDDQNEEEND